MNVSKTKTYTKSTAAVTYTARAVGMGMMSWMGERFSPGANGTSGSAWVKPSLVSPTLSSWEPPRPVMAATDLPHTFILGVPFFTGNAKEAVDRMLTGGLLVVPSAPTLKDIPTQPAYRAALLSADLVIPDSAYMVMIWNLLQGERLRRLSGLKYLRELLRRSEVRTPGSTVWIMAGRKSAALNVLWLRKQGVELPDTHVYIAPMYGPADGSELSDPALLEMVARLRPAHIVITVGGGTQERLGLYLRAGLNYTPGIHCIGAAIAFLSGDQNAIPVWADRLYLGWLLRILDNPKRYWPRYWAAVGLLQMLYKYRHTLPPVTH